MSRKVNSGPESSCDNQTVPELDTERLLATYPRRRPGLPPKQRDIYAAEIRANRTGGNWIIRRVNSLEAWMHRKVAAAARPGEEILEIGAGTLNHVPYETTAAAYDAVEPAAYLTNGSPHAGRLRALYRSLRDVPDSNCYDRVLSIAVLEHLDDLPGVVAAGARHLTRGGLFQVAVPNEGGLLWAIGWRLTTGLSYRLRNHASYSLVMRHEHINTAPEITAVLGWFFERVRVVQFPAPCLHAGFYRYIECSSPNQARVESYRGRS